MSLPHSGDAPIDCTDLDEIVDSIEWQPYSWIIYPEGGGYYAKNGETMVIEYSDPDADVLFQDVFDNCTSGDSIFIKNGTYPFNTTVTLDTSAEEIHNIHIIGESKGARIQPTDNIYAFTIGDTTHTNNWCHRLLVENLMFWPETAGIGSGMRLDLCFMPTVKDCDFNHCDTGLRVEYCSKSRVIRGTFQSFHTRGLYYPTSTAGLITDQAVHQSLISSTVDNSVGMEVEYNVNGITIDNCLFAGAGVNPALKITSSYSGIWLNNTVFDSIGDASHAYNGIEILGSSDEGVRDIQFSNVWIQSCGGYGLYIKGDATSGNVVSNGQFTGCKFANNQKAGIYIEDATFMFFDNCWVHNNGKADNATDYAMAQAYITDYASKILFNQCGFYAGGGRTNPQYVVVFKTDDDDEITSKFSDCYLNHATNQNFALIAYDRPAVAGGTVYIYAHDTYSRTAAVGAGVVISQIGAQAANQEQNVDSKNGTDGWWL